MLWVGSETPDCRETRIRIQWAGKCFINKTAHTFFSRTNTTVVTWFMRVHNNKTRLRCVVITLDLLKSGGCPIYSCESNKLSKSFKVLQILEVPPFPTAPLQLRLKVRVLPFCQLFESLLFKTAIECSILIQVALKMSVKLSGWKLK